MKSQERIALGFETYVGLVHFPLYIFFTSRVFFAFPKPEI